MRNEWLNQWEIRWTFLITCHGFTLVYNIIFHAPRRQNKIKIRQRLFTRRGISAASVEEKFRFLLFSINIAVRRFSTLRNIIFMWYEKFIFELSEVYDHAEPFIIETIKKASERESRRPCVSFFRSLIRNIEISQPKGEQNVVEDDNCEIWCVCHLPMVELSFLILFFSLLLFHPRSVSVKHTKILLDFWSSRGTHTQNEETINIDGEWK